MAKVFCECLYCGKKFERNVFAQSDMETISCPTCNEVGNVRKRRDDDTKKDVFGYNQTVQEDAYIKRQK